MFRFCSLLAALLLALPLWAAQPEITGPARIIDGDTLDIAGQRIRIGGIDAPESNERCTDTAGRTWRCGDWSTDQAKRLVAGQRLTCHDLGERTHQRIVGRCFVNGRDLAVALIELGAARPCIRFARAQGQERAYQQAESVAIAARAGIYAGPLNPAAGFCDPAPRSTQTAQTTTPAGDCAIKGNVSANGRIYHMPGQRDYNRVTMRSPDTRWFCSEAEARAAGWRRAQR